MDVCFSLAVHILILISEAEEPMSSAQIAESAGVNASQIRRIAGMLKQYGIITGRRGIPGFRLAWNTDEIKLIDIYRAVYGQDGVHLLRIHKNPNDECIVGRYIRPVLSGVFGAVEESAARTMSGMSLAGVISQMREAADADGVPAE